MVNWGIKPTIMPQSQHKCKQEMKCRLENSKQETGFFPNMPTSEQLLQERLL